MRLVLFTKKLLGIRDTEYKQPLAPIKKVDPLAEPIYRYVTDNDGSIDKLDILSYRGLQIVHIQFEKNSPMHVYVVPEELVTTLEGSELIKGNPFVGYWVIKKNFDKVNNILNYNDYQFESPDHPIKMSYSELTEAVLSTQITQETANQYLKGGDI